MKIVDLGNLVIKKDRRKCKNEEILTAEDLEIYLNGEDISGQTSEIIIKLKVDEPISFTIYNYALKND
mgnify:CR=1 FL=1